MNFEVMLTERELHDTLFELLDATYTNVKNAYDEVCKSDDRVSYLDIVDELHLALRNANVANKLAEARIAEEKETK